MDYKIRHRQTGFVVINEAGDVAGTYVTREQAANVILALGFPAAWRTRVASALPRRLTPALREKLVSEVAYSIVLWFSINPEILPYREKLRKLTKTADGLKKAIVKASRTLKRLGADPALGTFSADGFLCAIVSRAENDLARWDRLWRPAKARPLEFSASLTKRLRDDFNLICGKNARGFNRLIDEIQRPATHRHLRQHRRIPQLPPLSVGTLEKRQRRAK